MEIKNQNKRDELVGYIEKNEAYIIVYDKRKTTGKVIGNGRTEKQNDVLVAKRQKRKVRVLSPKGSQNLSIVSAYYKDTS